MGFQDLIVGTRTRALQSDCNSLIALAINFRNIRPERPGLARFCRHLIRSKDLLTLAPLSPRQACVRGCHCQVRQSNNKGSAHRRSRNRYAQQALRKGGSDHPVDDPLHGRTDDRQQPFAPRAMERNQKKVMDMLRASSL